MHDYTMRGWVWRVGTCVAAFVVAAAANAQTAPTDNGAAEKFVADYVKAWNAGDMEALGRMWADDAELVDAQGVALDRKALMANRMAKRDGARPMLAIELDNVRLLDPNVAMVEGESQMMTPQGAVLQQTKFSGVLVKRDGRWRIRMIRQISTRPPRQAPPADPLKEVAWLVGEWAGVGDGVRVRTSANWDLGKRYIVSQTEYEPEKGEPYDVEVRIGWDPEANSLKSWYFDSRGVTSTTLWSKSDDHWLGMISGMQSSGERFTGTMAITKIDQDSYLRTLTGMSAGGRAIPDQELRMFRLPEEPAESAGR